MKSSTSRLSLGAFIFSIHSTVIGAALVVIWLIALRPAWADSDIWTLDAGSGDWNTGANWRYGVVPNGPADVATFNLSQVTGISVSQNTEVSGIFYGLAASPFTITNIAGITLTLSGPGIRNNSPQEQTFVALSGPTGASGTIEFTGNASAGVLTKFTSDGANAYSLDEQGGALVFHDSSNAGTASFTEEGGRTKAALGGSVTFYDSSSAGFGTFSTQPGRVDQAGGGRVLFYDNATADHGKFHARAPYGSSAISFAGSATADHGTFTVDGTDEMGGPGAEVDFSNSATAGDATFIVQGANAPSVAQEGAGIVLFGDNATAGNATFKFTGGTVAGAYGGAMLFFTFNGMVPTAGEATLIAIGGTNGGYGGAIRLEDGNGGSARAEAFGNGDLDASYPGVVSNTIGSIEGDGNVFLGAVNLTMGLNDLGTTFSGVIQDGGVWGGVGGALTKSGKGTLTLLGASVYTGGTTVNQGTLLIVNSIGSATGTGPVTVFGGRLSGDGIIGGNVTVGSGSSVATLAPGGETNSGVLTIAGSLTFELSADYVVTITRSTSASGVVADGVTIGSGVVIDFDDKGSGTLAEGTVLTVIDNTADTPINGTFADLPDGGTIVVGSNTLHANYEGGDGNDLTLTVLP